MRDLICKHCSKVVAVADEICQSCGIPLPPDHGKSPQKKFILFFIAVSLFCLFMMFWLPPNWSRFLG